MLNKKPLFLLSAVACVSLTACGGGSGNNRAVVAPAPVNAVIAGVSFDYTTSDISIAKTEAPFDVVTGYDTKSQSDYGLDGFGSHYYRIGRYEIDTLSKYSIANPNLPVWEFSTKAPSESTKNPYDMVFESETKAYLIRYESPVSWVIDPSVSQAEGSSFKTGEIDLSAYNDADGAPESSKGVIANGKLFILMERLDKTAGWVPGEAYVAVFDINTLQEIDTNTTDAPSNLKGIKLDIRNPNELRVVGDRIYVSAVGNYYPQEFTGGIQSIDLDTYALANVLDDGPELGQISGLAIVSPTLGYFKGYTGWMNEALYQFNPSTGEVVDEPVNGLSGLMLTFLEVGPDNTLWVGVGSEEAPHVLVLNTADNTETGRIDLQRNPSEISFVSGE
jgi:hypothetical protein